MKMTEEKHMLPVKGNDGKWIYRSEVVNKEDSDESDFEEPRTDEVKTREVKKPRTLVHSYANERTKLTNVKHRVGLLCSAITGDPENNTRALKELILTLENPSTKMIVTEQKLVCISLMRVFADILPTYKIRTEQETDKKTKHKKQTKILMNYEMSLLRYYKKYIDALQRMVNGLRGKTQRKNGTVTATKRKAFQKLGIVATRCLCNLLVSRYYFNYYKSIVNIIVPLACIKNSVVSEMCCKSLESLYKSDKLGESSLEAVKQTVKVVKERKFCIPPRLLKTFLTLRLQEAKTDNKTPKTDMKKIRKQMATMSRKEKKYKKKMQELEQQLRETEAEENKECKSKLQTETLKKVFWIYFHVLKDDTKLALIAPVLEGLSKFAHMINLEFFDDLSSVLCTLMESGHLSDTEKLHCMQTMFVILSGQAESLNIDPQQLYSHLYNLLLNLQNSTALEQFHSTLKCLDVMVVKRKRNITYNRVLAFIKRLSTTCLQTPIHFTLGALNLVRTMFINTKDSDILLDTENAFGTGLFQPDLEDPEYCNPRSTSLWELCTLLNHYCPIVSTYARHIIYGCPFQGRLQLPEKLAKFSPEDILESFTEVAVGSKITFDDQKRPSKRQCIRNNTSDYLSTMDSDCNITWESVMNVNFCNSVNCQ